MFVWNMHVKQDGTKKRKNEKNVNSRKQIVIDDGTVESLDKQTCLIEN